MPQLNRREFLLSSAAVTAATALAPHILATPSEGAGQPSNSALQEASAVSFAQPRSARDWDFLNWRQQGVNFGGAVVHSGRFQV